MRERARGAVATVAAILGVGAMATAMMAIWTGQPPRDAMEPDVLAYYTANASRIRLGDVVWIAGVAAMMAAVVLIRRRFHAVPRRVFVGGTLFCGSTLIASAMVAWFLAGHAANGTIDAPTAYDRWYLQVALFEAGAFLLFVPVAAAAIGIDRERFFGVGMTVVGLVVAGSLVAPLAPWNFLAVLCWMAGVVAFVAHRPRSEEEIRHPEPRAQLAHAT